jgi:hypothetical protein
LRAVAFLSSTATLSAASLFVMDPTTVAAIAIVIAAGSEIIALLPIKENAWAQLILKALKVVFPKKLG